MAQASGLHGPHGHSHMPMWWPFNSRAEHLPQLTAKIALSVRPGTRTPFARRPVVVRSRVVALPLMALVSWALGGAARADGSFGHHHQLRMDFGIGSAVGTIGAAYVLQPIRYIQLEAAVGYGMSGTQTSIMGKLALGAPEIRFLSGGGVSIGWGDGNKESFFGFDRPVTWLNVDAVGAEFTYGRFVFLMAAGFTRILDGTYVCNRNCDGRERLEHTRENLPQFRVGFGGWIY